MRTKERTARMLTVATTGEKVREARRRAMLTQGELAEKSGVGITSIVRIERDQLDTSPRVSTLRKLAAALDVDPRELLDD
jgi:transcriptional regulator with XRE-family HTH domain